MSASDKRSTFCRFLGHKWKKRQYPKGVSEYTIPRIPAVELFPVIEDGKLPAKATQGEAFPIRATVFREGHDALCAEAVLIRPDGTEFSRTVMVDVAPGLDRYEAWVMPDDTGLWSFRVDTWSDPYATWKHDASVKIDAGVDVELMLEEGARLLERAAEGITLPRGKFKARQPGADVRAIFLEAAGRLRDTKGSPQQRLSAGVSSRVKAAFRDYPLRDLLDSTCSYPLKVARPKALAGSWYEIFPRSAGAFQKPDGTWVSGTLRGAAADLPRIASMGFDVIYLTPIHPIGTTFRKGKNNTLIAQAGDPGSPYGIGAPEGGHDAIHPDLGTFADFDDFVKAAQALDMEVALDLALQCSPDHPWVSEHPEWFTTRADGTIAYAENPPKKYQDIYPLNFDNDPEGIYNAIRDVVMLWVKHGVTFFRVDNPHTKPLQFWQRLIAEVHQTHPEIVFLAEAYTSGDDAHPWSYRFRPVVHLLHLATDKGRNRRVSAAGLPRHGASHASGLLADNTRYSYPANVERWNGDLRHPCRTCRNRRANVGHLLRL